MRAEADLNWGDNDLQVLIMLLPKPEGGLRPIGILPLILRAWMRTRVCKDLDE